MADPDGVNSTSMKVRSVDLGSPFLAELDGVCEVLLVRHGEQHYVNNMPLADGVDAPLTELGRRQAVAIGARLSERRIDAVFSSHLQRARDTGQAVADHHDLSVQQLHELAEINLWAGLPQEKGLLDSLERDQLTTIMREGNRTRSWTSYPYSEDRDAFRTRVARTLDQIIADHHGQRVVVACHGGVINAYLGHVTASPLDQMCSIHHTSISTVRGSGDQRRVVQVNDFSHVLAFQDTINPMNAL